MRTLLAIVMTIGLILNSGSGLVAAAHAEASMGAKGRAHGRSAASHPTMHAHGIEMGHCHKPPLKSPAHRCKCCDKKAKCTHESCTCLKCSSVLANVQPVSCAGIVVATLPGPAAVDKPPGSVRQPPPPPPQS